MESSKENRNISEQFPEVITINVGGCIYTTTIGTLRKYPQSDLAGMFSNHGKNGVKDKDGHYFIDRNGKYFEYILDYLRDEHCLPPVKVLKQVLIEATFYGLQKLVRKLETKYDFSARFPNVTPTYHAIRENISNFGLKTTLCITLKETTDRNWNGWPTSDRYSYHKTGSIEVACQNSKEAHSLINCLWKDLIREGFDANMEVLEFQTNIICKFDLKPEIHFNA